MNNSSSDFEDDIREPDSIIREQLMEDNRSEYDKQIDEAIKLSYKDMIEQQEMSRKYEEKLLKEYNEESNRRREIFRDFLLNLNKISRFDKEVREIYEIIEPIIDSYCNQYIELCELDEKMYDKIFGMLKKIRNNQVALNRLKTIIIKEIK
jgi:hypothetical protein